MNEGIDQLKEALLLSPDNIPLRLHLAELMMQEELWEDAGEQYQQVLNRNYGNVKARKGLAKLYARQQKYSAAIIIYEALFKSGQLNLDEQVLFVKCLIRERSMDEAMEIYRKLLEQDAHFRDEEIDAMLRSPAAGNLYLEDENNSLPESADGMMEEDESMGHFFMEKPDLKFADVGGMEQVKKEIALKIIQPLKNPSLYKAFGKKAGGGILLYGPPGCGKTYLAKATAGEIEAKFINIGLHDILDMWMGNSEKNLHAVFEQARRNAPCVLFFDEVDALGASRSDLKQSSMRHVINQFLAEMDGVSNSNEGVLILAATNAPWSIDGAFRRPGRFDRILFVAPPDEASRIEILKQQLKDKPFENIDYQAIAKATPACSGADLKAVVDIAIEAKLLDSLAKGAIENITTKDLLRAAKQHRPSTAEWFSTARNYALYANESGLYDEILQYLKLNK